MIAQMLRADTGSRALASRTAFWLVLGLIEVLTTSYLAHTNWFTRYQSPFFYLIQLSTWAIVSAVAFVLFAWPRRVELRDQWRREQSAHRWHAAVAINLASFAALAIASMALTAYAARQPSAQWGLVWLYIIVMAATGVSLLQMELPLAAWWRLIRAFPGEAAGAAATGSVIILLSVVSVYGWDLLAPYTLSLSKSILDLYETNVVVDVADRRLRVGEFAVLVTQNCSGYEGIALVTAFLSIYLWVFRAGLRFPRAFWLFPFGITLVWLLNGVRIAALTSIGAHLSPSVASKGFHSQAGWIVFLISSLSVIAIAEHLPFLRTAGRDAKPARGVAATPAATGDPAAAYLGPFMALMLVSVVVSAAAPYDRPLYALKVIAVAATLWCFRSVYMRLDWACPQIAVVAGGLTGMAWIATDPGTAAATDVGAWLAQQSPLVAIAWLLARIVGSCITVPIAEELAFRGFLQRWLVARNFENVAFSHLSWAAIVGSSALFGVMHERWLAGALSGVVFALVMQRRNSLSAAVVAHMTANALICAWAITFRQWSLL